ncbi:YbgA family protein [Tatumella sp. UBA2305]|uniref:YbgA family protein n=1 Tax=Tatumella sp. UBA2305 TaxID=1947647 RepID=UPI0025F2C871|nr:DUF1722 domain-containing protein [Tatumella sp. UBA2305]
MGIPLIIGVLSGEQSHLIAERSKQRLPGAFCLQPVTVHQQGDRVEIRGEINDVTPGFADGHALTVNGIITEHPLPSGFPTDIPFCSENTLLDSDQQHSFIAAVCAGAEFDALCAEPLTAHKLIQFHSRYKMLLLAHSQPLYRELGPLVAGVTACSSLQEFSLQYRRKLMQILMLPANRRDNTNALMHMQGYFRPFIAGERRRHLADTIDQYRRGVVSLSVAIDELRDLQAEYPHPWLASQRFLFPWLPDSPPRETPQEIP